MSDPLFSRFGREFRVGDVLFHEGELGEEMYVIQSGAVEITKAMGGVERPIATLGRGEFLGEMAILNGKPRTATARVVEDMKCLVLDKRTLEVMIQKNSEIALRLIKKLAARLDAADGLVQILLNPDPQARVLLALQRSAEAYGERTEDGIRVRLSPEQLAREVGVEPAQVVDVLWRLHRLKILHDPGDGSLVVADMGKLHEFLELVEMPQKFNEPFEGH
ncbi:MAG TPA: Crp/Fnr family transcriptional regulator [Polyangiaceae bacterium]|nr:Crp/Fnr family transcriptional regulator [Polyangiaceae bacterium]